MFDNLLFAREGAVALLTLNRPQSLNALNSALLDELQLAVQQIREEPGIRAAIITGSGDKAFAAGADLRELAALRPMQMLEHARKGQQVFDGLAALGKPVIAAINGFALGGGCELALACTLRMAADTARLGQPEVNLGLIPGFAGTQRLTRLVGKGRALEMLLTGRHLTADEAFNAGLVNRVVARAELLPAAQALAAALAEKPPLAVRCIIEAVSQGSEMPFDAGQRLEASLFGLIASTADMREGTRAFLEKRPPSFKGE